MEVTALILGFAGSLHCMGMCSPLMMSVTNMSSSVIANRLLYNTGRILTYGIFGGVVASVGFASPVLKYQNLISIVLGVVLVVVGLTRSPIRIPLITKIFGSFSNWLKCVFSKVLQSKTKFSILLMGSLNGVLPCGLSFLALSYCLTLQGPVDGFLFMLLFGVGTLPVMIGLTGVFHWAVKRLHFNAARLTTGLLVISGAILIARVFIVHLPHGESIHQGVVDIVLCR